MIKLFDITSLEHLTDFSLIEGYVKKNGLDNYSLTKIFTKDKFANSFHNIPNSLSCDANGRSKQGPVVILAIIALVGASAFSIAIINADNNCSEVAASCPNGVSSYEFEAGGFGGDCDVNCVGDNL